MKFKITFFQDWIKFLIKKKRNMFYLYQVFWHMENFLTFIKILKYYLKKDIYSSKIDIIL